MVTTEPEPRPAAAREVQPSAELLATVESLYERGLCRQAFEAATAAGPLERWRGEQACILAGRMAFNLGAPRLALRQHVRAYYSAPGKVRAQAYYLEAVLAMRGPVAAWQTFRRFQQGLPDPGSQPEADEGWEYLFTLGARICGLFRDFERAEELLQRAALRPSKTPWLLVERGGLCLMKESWEESLALGRQALQARPWYRPAVQEVAQCLRTLDRHEEALAFLQEAAQRLESLPVLQQLANLQMDLEQYGPALQTLERASGFSPIMDQGNAQWIAAQRCRAAGIRGELASAKEFAGQLKDEFHRELAARLEGPGASFRRVQLSVPFIQQYRLTCVPATLTMLCRFWQLPAEQVEVAEAICYDGTPSHRARRWAEANGLSTREFTLDWNSARALLERQVPFAVYTTEATSGHVQLVVGYDELRRSFILRNPSFPQVQEVAAERFLRRYAANGPGAMVAVPRTRPELLAGLEFPEADRYDALRQVQQALEEHRRTEAGERLEAMKGEAPGHWLSLTAARAVYAYDTNTVALNECVDKLLALFPEDPNLLLSKLGFLRETGRREERLEFLRGVCSRPEAEAIFYEQLAAEWMADARQAWPARLALKKGLRLQPMGGACLTRLAQFYWTERRFEEALDLYRQVACLEETKAGAAGTYFAAANARRQTEAGLAFLERRCQRNGARSPEPFITWFNALRQAGRGQEALAHLEEALRRQPEQGDLWLAAADAFARHGNFERADQCLASAEGQVQRSALLRVKADLARYRTDPKTALALWREVLQLEPLSIPVHRSLVWVLAETEGREAALKYLGELCARFPAHYQLHQLWAEWARGAGPEAAEQVTRQLVQQHPADAWAHRQLALVLCDAGRFEAALAEAEEALRLAPWDAVSPATRAHVRLKLGTVAAAQEDFRQAIRLVVDYGPAIHGLVTSYDTLAERREALGFVEQQLVAQVVFGEGLRAFRDAARLNLEPEELLRSVRAALQARPDLATAWSVVIQQLADMLELEEALSLAQQAAERFPLLEQVWLDLALVQRLRLDTQGEQAALEQAMRSSPASSTAVRLLAQQFERRGDMPRSKELLLEACARAPLDPYSQGSLALLLWRQGEQAAALERMRHAVRLYPGYGWGWQTLAAWGQASGQPKLAEELARQMVARRPGEVSSLLVLARLVAGAGRAEEALGLADQAVRVSEREIDPHELRAELLAALGRHAEAEAACAPAAWGKQVPAQLRACRARLQARRGNLVSAIEGMREVLRENPGYGAGWQHLADWLWQRKEHKAAIDAVTNLRRLDPLNPVPLGYRASLKLRNRERKGAKADLERALKYDPAYSFAALNLFELQLEDNEIESARQTLKLIERYAGAEKAKAYEVKLRTRLLQMPKPPPLPGRPPAPPPQAHELEQALARFKELCISPKAEAEDIDAAARALLNGGHKQRLEAALNAAIRLPHCAARAGHWWMRQRIARGKWTVTGPVSRLCLQSAAARQAVLTLVESLGETKPAGGRTIVLFYLLARLLKALERWGKGLAVLWLTWRHRRWLRADNSGWGSVGFALVRLRCFGLAVRWLGDWRRRPGLQMWMLLNLALALRSRWRYEQCREVLTAALNLPQRDQTFQKLRLLLAMELALTGATAEAAAHFHELNSAGWQEYMLVQYQLTRSLLAVQQAPPAERKKVIRAERAALGKFLAKHHVSLYRSDSRRVRNRMAKDSGSTWLRISTWLGL